MNRNVGLKDGVFFEAMFCVHSETDTDALVSTLVVGWRRYSPCHTVGIGSLKCLAVERQTIDSGTEALSVVAAIVCDFLCGNLLHAEVRGEGSSWRSEVSVAKRDCFRTRKTADDIFAAADTFYLAIFDNDVREMLVARLFHSRK